ncbi:MAG TPA: PAS domain-containing protein [Chitinophagaceae bacterium]|nr:PAS domain-containing protein [Chitinophagaceae bacterium]
MSRSNASKKSNYSHLAVIHRSHFTFKKEVNQTSDLIIHTDLDFNIKFANAATKLLFKNAGNDNISNLLDAGDILVENSSIEEVKTELLQKGDWSGSVQFTRFDGVLTNYKVTCTVVRDSNKNPASFVIIYNNIDAEVKKGSDLDEASQKYDSLLDALSSGVIMIDREFKMVACNKSGIEILGLQEREVIGQFISGKHLRAIKMDGTDFPFEKLPAMVSLQTGFPQRNVIVGLEKEGRDPVWLSINSEAIFKPGEIEPVAAVASFSDITNFIITEQELLKSNERFKYVTNVTTDAIWDFDLQANQIYRSEAFEKLSGYSSDEIGNNLNWWLDKIHPEDQARVKYKLENTLLKGEEQWKDEYRFVYKDDSYKYIRDSAIIIYYKGKAIRMIGAICDISEETILKQQLASEQKKRQREITRATIRAQEQEKANISRELHDNVNQIIMSAKLYMETAKNCPDDKEALLETAINYQMLAMQEIRKLSKSLNTEAIRQTRIKECISDIVYNLRELQKITVLVHIDEYVDSKLCETARLNVFRIIQEQTINIIKYASATVVEIKLLKADEGAILIVKDNGIGFDAAKVTTSSGIGFTNMKSRTFILDGKLKMETALGKGCELTLTFPIGKPIAQS